MSVFGDRLAEIADSGNLRKLPLVIHDGRYVYDGGLRMLNLSSNDYLGLASEENGLMQRFLERLSSGEFHKEDLLLSSTSSRLLTGNYSIYGRLEEQLCRMSGKEAALVFNSGYHMNIGILPAVSDPSTLIIADKLVHASIIDGIRLSDSRCIRFRHQDMCQLEKLVRKYVHEYPRIIIVTESIFSMDGDVADLEFMVSLKKKFPEVMLYVDEAHAAGVRGATGMGVAEELGVIHEIDFLCGTFGKALASVGAYVLCSSEVREYLVNRMRPLIFTTALPPVNLLWTSDVLDALPYMTERRAHLASIAGTVRDFLSDHGYGCPSESHIIPFMAGDSLRAVKMASLFQREGFYLLPIRPPTVPAGTSRLRISLTASVSQSEIVLLAGLLERAGKEII